MGKRIRSLTLSLALMVPLLLLGTSALAGISIEGDLEVEPVGGNDAPVFDFEWTGPPPEQLDCMDFEFAVEGPDGDVEGVIDVDGLTGTVDLTGEPAGDYELVLRCDFGQGETFVIDRADLTFARLTIDKNVEGDVPDGTTFVVEAACEPDENGDIGPAAMHEPFVAEREFEADGGSQAVIFYGPATCDIEETEDGGAESVTVSDGSVEIAEPTDYDVSVTNVFPASVDEPEEEEVDEPEEEDDEDEEEVDEPDEEIEEAEAAEPVEAEPTYTG